MFLDSITCWVLRCSPGTKVIPRRWGRGADAFVCTPCGFVVRGVMGFFRGRSRDTSRSKVVQVVYTSISTSFISFVSFMLFVPSICFFRCILGDNCCGWRKWRSGFAGWPSGRTKMAVKPLCEEPHCIILNCLYHRYRRMDVQLGLTEQWHLVSFLPSWATQHQTTQNDGHEQTFLLHGW